MVLDSGTGDDCYVDQPSVCDSTNAVECVSLATNTTNACCPRLTRCSPGYEASEDNVRCEIGYSDLMQLVATSSETSMFPTTAGSTSSSTATSSSTSTGLIEATQSAVSEPAKDGSVLSAGAIAGIAIGAGAGLALLLVGAYCWRRIWKARHASVNTGNSYNYPSYPHTQEYRQAVHYSIPSSSGAPDFRSVSQLNTPQPPNELHYQPPPQELQ
ncbi:hypothetical protein M426DRAFT_8212 [Hypoxylon sp. CI-4A]|nr:hypothetical protein M426DRAFT_8212 [Hypoxylon sp. CI-4A]